MFVGVSLEKRLPSYIAMVQGVLGGGVHRGVRGTLGDAVGS